MNTAQLHWQHRLSTKRFRCNGEQISSVTTQDTDDSSRTNFHIDYDRVVFSRAFRRLGRKTQVHPFANIIPANTFGLLQEVAADPSAFGFSNTTGVACNMPARTGGADDPASTSLACTPANLVTPTANEDYLFADDIHPSGRTHRILAQYYQSLLTAPSAIGQLPSVITRQGVSDYQALNRRLDTLPTGKHSVWIDGGVSHIDSGDATTDGVNPSVTIGAGFGGERSHTGAYAKFGWENYQLSDAINADVQSRGMGLYHRHELDKVGINLQAGVDRLSVDTDRQIAWEGAARTHTATAKGTRLHAGAQVGVTLGAGAFSYRPYVGINAQEVTIKDLVEDQSNLATAMRFHNQKQTSLQGEVGVNAAYQLAGKHRLYGGIGYTHEFKDDARAVSASLTSIPQYTRGFSLPVATADSSGVHAHLGAILDLLIPAIHAKHQGSYLSTKHELALDLLGFDQSAAHTLYDDYMSVLDFICSLTDNTAARLARDISGVGMI